MDLALSFVHLNIISYFSYRKLLAAADKYNIVDLKEACEKSLCSSVTVETVSSLLLFAQDRHVAELKVKSIEFISRNIQAVTESEGWQSLVNVPSLMTEVVRAMGPRTWNGNFQNQFWSPVRSDLWKKTLKKNICNLMSLKNNSEKWQSKTYDKTFEKIIVKSGLKVFRKYRWFQTTLKYILVKKSSLICGENSL